MNGALVDSNVVLDIFEDDESWADWSETTLNQFGASHVLCINSIIYSEISIGFSDIEDLEEAVNGCGFKLLPIPKEALFLAGKAFLQYRRRKGSKILPLPDFFIGAHAAVSGLKLITRDQKRIRTYFPKVDLVCPENA